MTIKNICSCRCLNQNLSHSNARFELEADIQKHNLGDIRLEILKQRCLMTANDPKRTCIHQ